MASKRKKKPVKSAKGKAPRSGPRKLLDDPGEEEVDPSVHHFDCSVHPPDFVLFEGNPPKYKDIVEFELKIKVKGLGNNETLKYKNVVDAIFLTKDARLRWEACNPPSNAKKR